MTERKWKIEFPEENVSQDFGDRMIRMELEGYAQYGPYQAYVYPNGIRVRYEGWVNNAGLKLLELAQKNWNKPVKEVGPTYNRDAEDTLLEGIRYLSELTKINTNLTEETRNRAIEGLNKMANDAAYRDQTDARARWAETGDLPSLQSLFLWDDSDEKYDFWTTVHGNNVTFLKNGKTQAWQKREYAGWAIEELNEHGGKIGCYRLAWSNLKQIRLAQAALKRDARKRSKNLTKSNGATIINNSEEPNTVAQS